MSLFDLLTRRERDATRVSISSTGQMSVDFAEVMKTSQFQKDLDAFSELAGNKSVVK